MKSLKYLWDNIKHNNIHILRVSGREKSEQGIKNLFEEIMAETFTNLVKKKVTEVHEAQSPNQDEPKEAHTKTHYD